MPGYRIIDLPFGIPVTGADLFEVSQLIGGIQTSVQVPFSQLSPNLGLNEIGFGDQFTGALSSTALFMRDPSTGWVGLNTNTPQAQIHSKGTLGSYAGKWDSGSGYDTYVMFDTSGNFTNRHQQYLKDSDQSMNYYTVNNKTIFWNGTMSQAKTFTLNADTSAKFEANLGVGGDPTARLNVEGGNVVFKRYGTNLNFQMDSDNTTEFDFKYNNTIKYALRADFGSTRQYYLGPNVTFVDTYQRIINGAGTAEIAYFDGTNNRIGFGKTNPSAKVDILLDTVGTGNKGISVNFNTIGEVFYIDDNGVAEFITNQGLKVTGGNGYINLISNGGVNPSVAFKFNNGASQSGYLAGDGNNMFLNCTNNFGISPTYINATATVHIKSGGASGTYAQKVDNSSSVSLYQLRDDGNFGYSTPAENVRMALLQTDNGDFTGIKTYANNGLQYSQLGWGGLSTSYYMKLQSGGGQDINLLPSSGYVLQPAKNLAISNSNLLASQMSSYINESTDELIFKVKYSDGVTVKTATIPLI